jgi:hypothetical protein
MLKQRETSPVEISLATFTRFNKNIFHDQTIPPDTYTPLTNPADHLITPEELTNILRYKYQSGEKQGLKPTTTVTTEIPWDRRNYMPGIFFE